MSQLKFLIKFNKNNIIIMKTIFTKFHQKKKLYIFFKIIGLLILKKIILRKWLYIYMHKLVLSITPKLLSLILEREVGVSITIIYREPIYEVSQVDERQLLSDSTYFRLKAKSEFFLRKDKFNNSIIFLK